MSEAWEAVMMDADEAVEVDERGDRTVGQHERDTQRYNCLFFLNEYLVDRAYGGPEEGGWWYECGHVERTLRVFRRLEDAWKYRERVGDRYLRAKNRGRRPISSVLSEGRYWLRIESHPGRHFPQFRPHYE